MSLVTHVLSGGGDRPALDVEQFNRVFRDLNSLRLKPSPAELTAPDTWLDHVKPAMDPSAR